MLANPYQLEPASTVVKPIISTPEDVSVGATPLGHLTDAGQLTVWLPPFVSINVNDAAMPLVGAPVKAKVFVFCLLYSEN